MGRQLECGLELLQSVQRQYPVLRLITYGALISARDKEKQPVQALEIFEALLRRGMVPSVITYSIQGPTGMSNLFLQSPDANMGCPAHVILVASLLLLLWVA